MKKMRKVIAVMVTLCMMVNLLGMSALAAQPTSEDQIVSDGNRIYYFAGGGRQTKITSMSGPARLFPARRTRMSLKSLCR